VVLFHKWDNTRRFIDAIDSQEPALITRGEGMKPWNPLTHDTPYYLETFALRSMLR